MQIRLVIFDLDGTLVDSLDDLAEAVNQMRAAFDAPPLLRDQVQAMVGQGARMLVERALPGRTPDEIERALLLFLAYNAAHIADHTRPYPGIAELLTSLRQSGVPMVVISNKNAALCRQLLTVLGLADHFAGVYGADSFAERKPSPLPFREVMRRHGVLAAETVVVGDSCNDVQAALAAEVAVIGCNYGYGSEEELAPATLRVASPADLHVLLSGMVAA